MRFISIVNILILFFCSLLVIIYIGSNSYSILPIKMGCSASSGWNPWEITYQRKIFEENNLKLDLVWFDSYQESIKAMVDGKLDVNCQTLDETIISATKKVDQIIVLINNSSIGNNKVIAREEVQTITDLKDKNIAVELGSVDHFLLLLGLKDVGLSQKDIKIQSMSAAAATNTFYQGELDAIGVPSPYTNRALERPGSKELLSSEDYSGVISGHLVVTRKLVDEKPQVVQALINSWYKTLHYMQVHPIG